jgi:hypothetical protein
MKGILLALIAASVIAVSATPAMARRYRVAYPVYGPVVYPAYPVRAYYPRRVYTPVYPVYPVYPAYPVTVYYGW